jgi:peptidoglycan hydrolase CwlO-like protein
VLLVILSLLLSAATVTFVNAIGNQRKALQLSLDTALAEKARADKLAADKDSDAARVTENYRLATQQIETMKQQSNQTSQLIADRDAKLQDANTKLAMLSADVTRLGEALKASEDAKAKFNDTIVSQRQTLDQLQTQSAQMNTQINDLVNKLEVTESARRFATEQLEQLRQDNTKLGAALKDAGISVASALQTGGTGRGAVKINGVVTDVRTIAGRPYATISVGSVDSVVKGMQFNLVDRDNGAFLGTMTVVTVEPNEASGPLQGPRVADVHKGVEVRTQIQS